MVAILPNQQHPAALGRLLKAKGTGDKCYLFSENSTLDGQEVDLEAALEEAVDRQIGNAHLMRTGEIGLF
jgi:hypothetical protein